jgi:hypothetical protein
MSGRTLRRERREKDEAVRGERGSWTDVSQNEEASNNNNNNSTYYDVDNE